MYMKGGDALYRYQVQSTTTLPMTPDQIHALGLSEVARITKEFEKVQAEVGFKGNLRAFFDYMRTSPKFAPATRSQLNQDFYRIKSAVDAKVPQYFSVTPKTPLVIRPYPPYREKFEAGGSYDSGTPDGSRPGTFYFNAYDLPSRFTWEETTLFLHEGEPGHHFQISLAQENKALPSFMRFGGNTAYVEGWALYSETLGYPMGFYADPIQRFGTLNDEMLRAMRLVVDTGIHAKGWTRDQAIDYMLSHSGESKTDATAEVERYIAIPSQATAYKVGALTIQRLRDKAKAALGRQVRHPRLPCAGAGQRRAAADDPRRKDRRLDRGEEGELGQLDERCELDLALDEAGFVAADGRVGGEHRVAQRVELSHVRAVEQDEQVALAGRLVTELDLRGRAQPFLQRSLALVVGMLGKLDEDKSAQPLAGQAIATRSAMVRAIQPSARSRRSRRAIADGDSATRAASWSAVCESSAWTRFSSARSKRSSIG